jgi:multidrug efflux pump subunit AcrA (membrane-fusion protein)
VERWFVRDGDRVRRGDPIARIVDNDPNLLARLAAERAQVLAEIAAAEQDYGYWVSYNPVAHNPRARLHVVRIDRNQADIDKMAQRIAMAAEYRDQIIQRIRSL